ncbi:DUF3429 domain-containing protein [Citreimonas salinaria]|uniref:DUF3429 domain-containing protein n=1 Tax=Citreimonas salinaria TaxID=321339 RepID=A0A1H3F2J7_9RHOB|nr:DUF3429 domain-containing protein [Citreimonas salinaria]SDX85100.1 Protein of unknown function [Citreimonas salinaria]
MSIPRSALFLGLAGVLPFLWGALTVLYDPLAMWSQTTLGSRFTGPYVQLFYGAVLLSFMSGVLWGFATKAEGARAAAGYALSVLPALWAFFMTGGGADAAGQSLVIGFLGLLLLDWQFWRRGLAPSWWMRLRGLLTALVVICLSVHLVV